MSDTWGNLEQSEREAIRSTARTMSEAEIADRFVEYDDRVTFKIVRKTDRALAGDLDITLTSDPDLVLDDTDSLGLEAADLELAAEVRQEHEVVEVTLISPDDFDYEPEITDADRDAARGVDASLADLEVFFGPGDATSGAAEYAEDGIGEGDGDGNLGVLPPVVDHRLQQSPVKSQGSRGTCVSHAAVALIETFGHIPDDLSEQYTHYKFNEFLGRPHNANQGLRTTDAAPFLARNDGRVCLESEWPYIRFQSTINQQVADGVYDPPADAVGNQTYGYGSYKIITDQGLTGQSIKNTRYLEALLYRGYDIVIGTFVSWDDVDGVLRPVLDENGNPVGRGGHAMVVVGYDRTNQYFIVKNSWGTGWEHDGYGYVHYSLVRSCFKYGYVVESVEPPAPSPLPAKLINAPFNTTSISRSDLRAAVVFFKTSAGRFAVAEAYAGYNLYLRNLRVYNADGTVHLERDSLTVRGTYLADLDSGAETSSGADFWWQAVRPGVNNLVPRNGASAVVAYNLAALRSNDIEARPRPSSPIPWANLDYGVIVGKTTANRNYKMLVHARSDNSLLISYLEVFNTDGSRYRYRTNVEIPSSWTYNLDTLRQGGGQWADIWWHVISDGVGFLEKRSSADTGFVWSL